MLHIRLHQPFLPNWRALAASRLDTWGMPCLALWKQERVVRLAPLEQLEWSRPKTVVGDPLLHVSTRSSRSSKRDTARS